MAKFQETLKNFSKMLQSRDVFKKLNIEERNPENYDLEYVQRIAALIHEHKEGEENTRSVKRFILRCFRSAHEHRTTLTCLLDMVPNDLYGSVMSGGFSLILAVSPCFQAHDEILLLSLGCETIGYRKQLRRAGENSKSPRHYPQKTARDPAVD